MSTIKTAKESSGHYLSPVRQEQNKKDHKSEDATKNEAIDFRH